METTEANPAPDDLARYREFVRQSRARFWQAQREKEALRRTRRTWIDFLYELDRGRYPEVEEEVRLRLIEILNRLDHESDKPWPKE